MDKNSITEMLKMVNPREIIKYKKLMESRNMDIAKKKYEKYLRSKIYK